MKVYLVVDQDYEQYDILGAYFDKDKASERMIIETRELHLRKCKIWPERYVNTCSYSEGIMIEEITVE